MKNRETQWKATYAPAEFKTFAGAFSSFIRQECPEYGGERVRLALVRGIEEMVHQFFPATSHLQQGQTTWTCVHKDARGTYGKRIQDTELAHVVVSLVGPDDAAKRAAGTPLREIKKEALARICKECYQQNGVTTQAELSLLLKMSTSCVGKMIREWESERMEVLPTRGTIHDMGPTLTHKKIIIEKLFINGHSVQQVSLETFHSFSAIQRYIGSFKKVLLCSRKGLAPDEIATATGHSVRLIKQYLDIIKEYKDRNQTLEKLLDYEVKMDSRWEQIIQELTTKK